MKSARPFIALCCCSLTYIASCADIKEYKAFIAEWITTFIQSPGERLLITPAEFNVLLNFAYFSYARSAATIAAQEATLSALTTNWQLLQNVTQTRRNPSKQIPYELDAKSYGKRMKQAWLLQQEHENQGTTYAKMLDYILKQDPSLRDSMRTCIERAREQARVALVDSLSTVKDYLQSLIDACQKNRTSLEYPDRMLPNKGIAVFDYLMALAPQFATSSFVATDRMSIQVSEEGWHILSEIQRINNVIWTVIEKRRANFYAIMYRALYECAQSIEADASLFAISFDRNGFIDLPHKSARLPTPNSITLYA